MREILKTSGIMSEAVKKTFLQRLCIEPERAIRGPAGDRGAVYCRNLNAGYSSESACYYPNQGARTAFSCLRRTPWILMLIRVPDVEGFCGLE